jgi:uncharacterized protein YneF (UPF0154 family)
MPKRNFSFGFETLIFRLEDNWELFHVINAVMILMLGVAGSIFIADKQVDDENLSHQDKVIEEQIKQIKAIQKDEYMLYDDEDEEQVKKSAEKKKEVKTLTNGKYLTLTQL